MSAEPLRLAVVVLMTFALVIGCAGPMPAWRSASAERLTSDVAGDDQQRWSELAPQDQRTRKPRRWSGGVMAVASVRPAVPNAGLQLPRFSPDGKWVAYLQMQEGAPAVSPDALVSGKGLDPVSLWMRRVGDEDPNDVEPRNIAIGGAAWPTWSSDGSTLLFVSHDDQNGCALMMHEVATGVTRRWSVGLRRMLSPAWSPSGEQLAVVAYDEVAEQAGVFVIDRESGRVTSGPPPLVPAGGAQVLPRWLDDETLLWVELGERGGSLVRWRVGDAASERVALVDVPASLFDAIHLDAGLSEPLSPDRRFFGYYRATRDRIELVELSSGRVLAMQAGDRAGAWWGGSWFLIANDERLELCAVPGDGAAEAGDDLRRLPLLPGSWVPRWSGPVEGSMLLLGRDSDPGMLTVLQLWVVAREDVE